MSWEDAIAELSSQPTEYYTSLSSSGNLRYSSGYGYIIRDSSQRTTYWDQRMVIYYDDGQWYAGEI